ncbi:MAG: PIN domain-containing protein [Solirubrobacteraceae bacterium]
MALVLSLANFAISLAAFDTASPLGGLGASRTTWIGSFAEPALILVFFTGRAHPDPAAPRVRRDWRVQFRPHRGGSRGDARRRVRSLTLLVDIGVLLAAADRSDPAHEACRDLLESHPGPLITTELVLAETGWLLDRQLEPAAEAALYRSVASGELVVEPLSRADWTRIAELTDTPAASSSGVSDWRAASSARSAASSPGSFTVMLIACSVYEPVWPEPARARSRLLSPLRDGSGSSRPGGHPWA